MIVSLEGDVKSWVRADDETTIGWFSPGGLTSDGDQQSDGDGWGLEVTGISSQGRLTGSRRAEIRWRVSPAHGDHIQ
jgi:hypothetical protein